MINQINQTINKNVYAPLQSSGANYAITKSFTNPQQTTIEKEQDKKSTKIGIKIVGIVLAVAVGGFLLTKAVPKSLHDRLFRRLEREMEKLGSEKKLSPLRNFYLLSLRNIKSVLTKSRAIYNISPVKDILVQRALTKVPFLNRLGEKITNVFEKISVRTSKKSYQRTWAKFEETLNAFSEASKNLPQKEAKEVEERINALRSHYIEHFSLIARSKRLVETKKDLSGLSEDVWEKTWAHPQKFIVDPKTYQTFISEELASGAKGNLHHKVYPLRKEITNDLNDNYVAVKKILRMIDSFIDPTDEASTAFIRKINGTLRAYKEVALNEDIAKDIILSESIPENLEKLKTYIPTYTSALGKTYDTTKVLQASASIDNLCSVLRENKKGEIQEILGIFRKHLQGSPEKDKEYFSLRKRTYKMIKSFDRSVDLEVDKLFDKIRDLQVGVAPTDALAVLSSLGVIGWGLSKADNNDERASVLLKYGIPAVGGITIAIVCAAGLISAGPSLIIGVISGAAINKLGIVADNARKKYQGKHVNQNEESMAEMGLQKVKEKAEEVQRKTNLNII